MFRILCHRGFLQPTKVRGAQLSGYTQLTQEERYQIYALKKAGHSQAEIATPMGRDKSTISRELRIKQVARFFDVVRKNPTRRLEYKAWESGQPSWGKVGGKEGAEWEFVRDILSKKPFEWVIKGTDLEKVATKMKQTLGVLKLRGRAKAQLHPILEEALRRGRITKADIEKIIAQIDSGELLRVQGY